MLSHVLFVPRLPHLQNDFIPIAWVDSRADNDATTLLLQWFSFTRR